MLLYKEERVGKGCFGRKFIGGEGEFQVVVPSNWLGCCWVRRKSSFSLQAYIKEAVVNTE